MVRFRPSYFRWTIVVLASLVPALAIGVYSIVTAQRSINRISIENNLAIASIASETIRQQLQKSIEISRIIAAFPVFANSAEQRDVDAVRDRLRRAVESSPEIDRAYVLDPEGVLWCDWPVAPESLGQSFAYRDYFTGIAGKWQPYVSEVFQRQAEPKPFVIAVSSAVRNASGKVVGVLVLQYRLDTVTHWLGRVHMGKRGSVIVLDHTGSVAGHSAISRPAEPYKQYADVDAVREALRGMASRERYTDPISGREMIAIFQPLRLSADRYWVIIAEQDVDEALVPLKELAGHISLAAAIVALLALVAGVLLARTSERNRLMRIELAEHNERLQDAMDAERAAHEALKKAQGQLVEQEKLAGLGQMVAGIAHEINNPLSFVSNNIAVLQRDLPALRELVSIYQRGDAALAEHQPELMRVIGERAEAMDLNYTLPNLDDLLSRSREGLRRIQQIVKDLRDFARLDENMVAEADINAGVESTVNIIRGRAKKKNVDIVVDAGHVALLTCCPSRVNQVIMNLIANAIDASSEGGCVKVRTFEEGGSVCVEVSDRGSGIDPAVMGRIFDPFFTTKPQGEGVGLGLSISYGIARDHGGSIDVRSEPGRGATFTLRLPVRCDQVSPLV